MIMRKLLCLLWGMVIQTSLYAQDTKIVIDNQTPGRLSSLLTYSHQAVVEDLTVTGYVNESDMSFVNNLIKNQKLKILDVTNSTLISSEKGENYIWSGFLNFGDEKTLQKLKMPKTLKGVIWNVYGSDYTPIILSHVDTLEMGYEDLSIFTKFQEYRDGESISKYPPLHLILLNGVKVIPDYCFSYSRGYMNPSASCVVTLSNTITHIGGRAFDSSFIFDNFTFPDSIEYLGRHPVINEMANRYPVHGLATDNCWAYNSTVNISKKRFEFPNNLRFYNSLHYVKSGSSIVTYDSYSSDTIIVGSKCDTLFAKVKAKIAYFYNKKPVAFWSHEDMMIDTLYIPNGCMSEYLNEYDYYEALRPESGIQIKAIKEMKPIQGIEIICENYTCQIGDVIRLKARITPEDAFNKSIIWSSSDTSIASVNNKGAVTALHGGEVWIKAISEENAEVKDSCEIVVIQPVTGITLSQENCQLNRLGESIQLEATVLPENATNKDVSWTSSNEDVCVVANGKVIATGFGTAVVKATTLDGNYSALCFVRVYQHVEMVWLNKSSISLKVGEKEQLIAKVIPDNVANRTIVWSSSDNEIATVDDKGNVTAVKVGETWIFATSEDNPEAKDSCQIVVPDIPAPAPNGDCATPTIVVSGNKMTFECETPDAEFTSYLTTSEEFSGGEVVIENKDITFTLTVYAIAPGYDRSKPATMKFTVKKSDVNGDGTVDVADIATIISEMAARARMQEETEE